MADKVCATRKSKAHPDVYTVKELRAQAIEEGHEKALVNKLPKSNLCALLNIDWEGAKPKKKVKKANTKELTQWVDRKCDVQPSKINPTAFKKSELVSLAVKHLSLKNANAHTKEQLCYLLKDAKVKIPTALPAAKKTVKKEAKVKSRSPLKKKTVKIVKKNTAKPVKKTTKEESAKKAVVKKKVVLKKVKTEGAKKESPKKKSPVKKKTPKKDASPKKTVKTVKVAQKSSQKSGKSSKKKTILTQEDGDCIERSRLKLKPHQIKLVEHLKTHRGIIAAFEVGSGKTLTAVAASQCYLDENPKGKVIIVTPKSLQENFKKELEAYGGDINDKRYEFYTIRKFATTYEKGCPHNVFLVIDEAHNLRTAIKGDVGKGKTPKNTPKKVSKKKGEKGESIANAKIAVRCAKAVDKVLLLTATPLYNKPHDLINLVAMVKGTNPLTKREFEMKSVKEMCEYFRDTIMYFKNPVSDEYPDKVEHTIRVIMTPAFYRGYRDVEQQKSHLWSAANPFSFLTVVRQATNAVDPCLKCEWAIRKIMEGEKTLVYSAFVTHGVKKLQSMLDDLNVEYVEVTGSMSMEDRKDAVNKYNNNKVKVMFITKAGGEGLDLKGTRNVILLEKSWNRPNEEQIIGRAVRFRSHTHLPKDQQKVDVYHLIIVKPAPEKRDKNDKKDSADEMLDELTKEKEKDNRNFQLLLESVSIDAPAGTKCPPPIFKPMQFGKPQKEDKYKVTITEYKNTFHHQIPTGIDKAKEAEIIKLINKPEEKIKFVRGASYFEITFPSKNKGSVPKLVRDIVAHIVAGTKYEIARGKGAWTGSEKNEYKYTFERRFK